MVRGQHGGQGQDISTAKLKGVGPLQLVEMDSELDNTDTGNIVIFNTKHKLEDPYIRTEVS